jgi:hypothetical protein
MFCQLLFFAKAPMPVACIKEEIGTNYARINATVHLYLDPNLPKFNHFN